MVALHAGVVTGRPRGVSLRRGVVSASTVIGRPRRTVASQLEWFVTPGVTMAVLLVDVVFSTRRPREPKKRDCAIALSFYVGLAVPFGLWVWFFHGGQYGLEFIAGWLPENINSSEHVAVPQILTLLSLAVIVMTLVTTVYKTRVVDKG